MRQAHFLVFPWMRVPCLASKALGLSLRQLAADWQCVHGVRPVLVETYVSQPYAGTCSRGSNWHYQGHTQPRGAMGTVPATNTQGRLGVSAAAGLAGSPARDLTPGPLRLNARLLRISQFDSPALLRPDF